MTLKQDLRSRVHWSGRSFVGLSMAMLASLVVISVSLAIQPAVSEAAATKAASRPASRPATRPASHPAVPSHEVSAGPLALVERAIEAHGGTETWRSLGEATFEFEMLRFDSTGQPAGPPMPIGISFPTLGSAVMEGAMGEVRMRYENGATSVSNSHGEISDPAMHAQARFMLPTFHYIFSLPWKLQDEGAVFESIPGRIDGDRELDGVRVTYRPGVGESPDDWYKFYFDGESGRLHDVLWIITAPGHDNTIEWCRFEDQRLVEGIWLPHQWTFVHAREDGEPLGPPVMRARLVRVSFARQDEATPTESQPASRPGSQPASRPADRPASRPAAEPAS